jgi:uncharacterized protein (DUF885 family)
MILIRMAVILLTMTLLLAVSGESDIDRRRAALAGLLTEFSQWSSAANADLRITDFSDAAIDLRIHQLRRYLDRLDNIGTRGFGDVERLNAAILHRWLSERVEQAELRPWKMPVTQFAGMHLEAAQIAARQEIRTRQDFDAYLMMLRQVPVQLEETIALAREGIALGLVPPRTLLRQVADQADRIGSLPVKQSPFFAPLTVESFRGAEAQRPQMQRQLQLVIENEVAPAYQSFARFVRDVYVPEGRTDVGLWALPDGERRYAFAVRKATTADLTPEEIHQIGLLEVERIGAEISALSKKLGYARLEDLNRAVATSRTMVAKNRNDVLESYQQHIDSIQKMLPHYFGTLPRAGVEIASIESFREAEAPGAQYVASNGRSPARILVNTAPDARHKLGFESNAYHEGVPGHHLQIAVARDLQMASFRRHLDYQAFTEGWALYAERLAKEMGGFSDPYSDYGRLQAEMLRAIRLVVDTGLHHKRWSREQAREFFRNHSVMGNRGIDVEIDRYLAIPAQALSYKIGELKILQLRERATRELDADFDIRRFHDTILGGGPLPLDLLEERVDQWIAAENSRATQQASMRIDLSRLALAR